MAKKVVQEQKGRIEPNPMTRKQMGYIEKALDQHMENIMIKRNQTLDLHEPKQ